MTEINLPNGWYSVNPPFTSIRHEAYIFKVYVQDGEIIAGNGLASGIFDQLPNYTEKEYFTSGRFHADVNLTREEVIKRVKALCPKKEIVVPLPSVSRWRLDLE